LGVLVNSVSDAVYGSDEEETYEDSVIDSVYENVEEPMLFSTMGPSPAVPSIEPGIYTEPVGEVALTAEDGMQIYWATYDWGDIYWYNLYTGPISNPTSLYVIVYDPVTGLQSEVQELIYNVVDGIIVPSAEAGSTGGLEVSFTSDDYSKKFHIDQTALGERYSLLIYHNDGTPIDYQETDFSIWIKDQNGIMVTGSGPNNVAPNGVPKVGFTAKWSHITIGFPMRQLIRYSFLHTPSSLPAHP
jgi:hypothetical protein